MITFLLTEAHLARAAPIRKIWCEATIKDFSGNVYEILLSSQSHINKLKKGDVQGNKFKRGDVQWRMCETCNGTCN